MRVNTKCQRPHLTALNLIHIPESILGNDSIVVEDTFDCHEVIHETQEMDNDVNSVTHEMIPETQEIGNEVFPESLIVDNTFISHSSSILSAHNSSSLSALATPFISSELLSGFKTLVSD